MMGRKKSTRLISMYRSETQVSITLKCMHTNGIFNEGVNWYHHWDLEATGEGHWPKLCVLSLWMNYATSRACDSDSYVSWPQAVPL